MDPAAMAPPPGPDLMTMLPQMIQQAVQQAMAQSGGGGAPGGGAAGAAAGKKPDVGLELQRMNRIINKLLTFQVMLAQNLGMELPPQLALEPEDQMLPSQMAAPPATAGASPAGAPGAPAAPPTLPAPFPQINPMQGFGQPGAAAPGGGGGGGEGKKASWHDTVRGANDVIRALGKRNS